MDGAFGEDPVLQPLNEHDAQGELSRMLLDQLCQGQDFLSFRDGHGFLGEGPLFPTSA